MEFTFDGPGVTRLIQNLLWVASQGGAIAPERAGLIQSLATRLGLDMTGVAELSKAPRFEKPQARSEAEATYLATVVMLAQSPQVSQEDRDRLQELGETLDLGLAAPQLHTLARAGAPLGGFRSSVDAVDVGASASARKRAGERLRKRSKKGVSDRASRASLDALAGGATASKGGGRLFALGSALSLLAIGALGAWFMASSRGGTGPVDSGTSTAPRTPFEERVAAWKKQFAGPDSTLDELRAIQDVVNAAVAQSEDAAKSKAAGAFLLSPEWKREWTDATAVYEDQVRDELLLAAQEGRLAGASAILAKIPPDIAQGASWPAQLRGEVAAWLAFSKEVAALVAQPKPPKRDAKIAQLEQAFALRKRGMACEAQPTQAFDVLTKWFKDQWESANDVQRQATATIAKHDAGALRRYGEILVLMGRPSRAYADRLASGAKAMVLRAVAEGKFKVAREFLAGLPTEYVPRGWVKERQAELDGWETFSTDVAALAAKEPPGLEEYLKAWDLFVGGNGAITPAHGKLLAWIESHKEAGSEVAYAEWRKTLTLDDKEKSEQWIEVLVLLQGSNAAAFLRSKVSEDLPELGAEIEGLEPTAGSGTGFYVTAHKILTNAHVVSGHTTVVVQSGDTKRDGKVIAVEAELDVALVETKEPGKPVIGFSPRCEPGTVVFAMGYGTLAGESKTMLVTRGAISARLTDQRRIVFDATINPGNSGGPLVDSLGRMVGVVVAKSSSAREWVDSLAYAVDGRAAHTWLEAQAVTLAELPAEATAQTPPTAVRDSVVRLLVGMERD